MCVKTFSIFYNKTIILAQAYENAICFYDSIIRRQTEI